jgi:hypothetical protein
MAESVSHQEAQTLRMAAKATGFIQLYAGNKEQLLPVGQLLLSEY